MNKKATKTKKATAGLLAASILVGGVATTVAPVQANAASQTIHEKQEASKPFYEKGIINSFKSETVQIDDQNIAYDIRKGNAHPEKTYVIVHGATATKNYMKTYAAEIAQKEPNARIIILDLPNHGESTGNKDDLANRTVYDYVDYMEKFLEEKTADGTIQGTLNWSGWSMGGSIGMLLDLKGVQIDELTLLDSSPYWKFIDLIPESTKESVKGTLSSEFNKHVTEEESKDLYDNIYNLMTKDEDVVKRDLKGLAPAIFDIRDQIKNIKAKTLIIGGTEDALAPVSMFELMAQEIPNSKLVMYEDSHSQMIKPTQAKQIVQELENFYNN